MGVLRNIALAVLSLSALVFVALFGRLPALRNTPVGLLHRVLLVHIPKACRRADYALTGGRLTQRLSDVGDYLIHENHPIIMIVWLSILTFAALAFLSSSWHRLASHHKFVFVPVLLSAPYIFTYLCCASTSSFVTPDSVAADLDQYPYDHTIFHPNKGCSTCNLPKPARSKHCSLCHACVARHDHHCVWVMNCLGRDNYRHFLGLLLSLLVLLSYGTYLAYELLHPLSSRPRKHKVVPTNFNSNQQASGFVPRLQSRRAAWEEAVRQDVRVGSVGLLALLTAPLAAGLLGYHCYLLWAGTTTNETAKWSDLRDDMADGLVWSGRRLPTPDQKDEERRRWPITSTQVVVRASVAEEGAGKTDSPARTPVAGHGSEPNPFEAAAPRLRFAADGSTPVRDWRRCWRLGQVVNLYDVGFVATLREVLVPGTLAREAAAKAARLSPTLRVAWPAVAEPAAG